jgi:hypothetical protein
VRPFSGKAFEISNLRFEINAVQKMHKNGDFLPPAMDFIGGNFRRRIEIEKTPEPLTFVPSESCSNLRRLSWDSIDLKIQICDWK